MRRVLTIVFMTTALFVISGGYGGVGGALPMLDSTEPVQGYFFAKSSTPDETALGGFSTSTNSPLPITPDMQCAGAIVQLCVDRNKLLPFRYEFVRMGYLPESGSPHALSYQGFEVLLINGTDEPIVFGASDSCLRIIREALDTDGEWKPIEILPHSWCGNSYHRVTLAPRTYWSFVAPVYAGPFRTQMRFKLGEYYSDEFDGTIHRSQFHSKHEAR